LHQQYDWHAHASRSKHAVGITNCFGFGALLAREKLGMQVLTVHCQPAVIWSGLQPPALPGLGGPRWLQRIGYAVGERWVVDRVVCPFLNPWRAKLGLAPMRRTTRWWHSPDGVLCMFPAWYAAPQPDWPQPLRQTDFPLWNHASHPSLDASVEAFLCAGDRPIVFTPGSANLHGRDFFRTAVNTCRRLGRRAILLSEFPQQIPQPLPADIAYFPYVPLDQLLPRCAAFVHHGGIGSTSQALLAGIPQVIMPLAHDQFDNARRVRRLEVGSRLAVRHFTPGRLIPLLTYLLDSDSVQLQCRNAAARLAMRDGLTRSAAAVEELVGLRSLHGPKPSAATDARYQPKSTSRDHLRNQTGV
jgi:rhamnosyltransferase subunit B